MPLSSRTTSHGSDADENRAPCFCFYTYSYAVRALQSISLSNDKSLTLWGQISNYIFPNFDVLFVRAETRARISYEFEQASEATAEELDQLVTEAEYILQVLAKMDGNQKTFNVLVQKELKGVKMNQTRLENPSVSITSA